MDEAEDVCADVFVNAKRHFDVLRDLPSGEARGWLVTAARNRCANVFRSRARRDRAYRRVAIHPDHDGDDPFDAGWLEQVSDDGQLADRIEQVSEALPERLREVIRLDRDAVLSGRELAKALGTTEGAARLRRMRARHAFRAEYVRCFGLPWGDLDDESALP